MGLVTWNVRSLWTACKAVEGWAPIQELLDQDLDVLFLQETKITPRYAEKSFHGFDDYVLTHGYAAGEGGAASGGVCIAIRKTWARPGMQVSRYEHLCDNLERNGGREHGVFLPPLLPGLRPYVLPLVFGTAATGGWMLVVNVYCPPARPDLQRDIYQFLTALVDVASTIGCARVLVGGDFNTDMCDCNGEPGRARGIRLAVAPGTRDPTWHGTQGSAITRIDEWLHWGPMGASPVELVDHLANTSDHTPLGIRVEVGDLGMARLDPVLDPEPMETEEDVDERVGVLQTPLLKEAETEIRRCVVAELGPDCRRFAQAVDQAESSAKRRWDSAGAHALARETFEGADLSLAVLLRAAMRVAVRVAPKRTRSTPGPAPRWQRGQTGHMRGGPAREYRRMVHKRALCRVVRMAVLHPTGYATPLADKESSLTREFPELSRPDRATPDSEEEREWLQRLHEAGVAVAGKEARRLELKEQRRNKTSWVRRLQHMAQVSPKLAHRWLFSSGTPKGSLHRAIDQTGAVRTDPAGVKQAVEEHFRKVSAAVVPQHDGAVQDFPWRTEADRVDIVTPPPDVDGRKQGWPPNLHQIELRGLRETKH